MITDQVIQEAYRKFKKPPKNPEELNLDYFLGLLSKHHNLRQFDGEIFIEDLEEFSPFRRFLIRSIHAVLEFDKMVAFIFRNHILFFSKEDNQLRVHMRPEKPLSIFEKIFGRRD